MPTNPWSPSSQYSSTVLNDPSAIPLHAAPAAAPHASATTLPRPRQSSAQLQQGLQAQQGPFTAAQRSAQARGKPFITPATTSGSSRSRHNDPESYAQRERRNEAAAILDSQEMLIWYAASRNESVSQTRRYYLNVVLGVEESPRDWKEEWEVRPMETGGPGSPKGKPPKGKGKEREKERERGAKKRFSAGGPHVTYGGGE
ncbi:hypothetical protein BU25DRAFT_208071 [Macroventuria anomochaeta]|uniref:Uncharacterized protein n=1 Tax=Macroventuria anomochaeta TaxID=301207 RepID=A0ACB6RNB8_9PLEO|nr:uncharacterized protein BU25DRAFT_208071 [Macroventuria anomochaeta]KAF2622649.1 hypothetical protein BU25DRAFT_208071 [Macroventuria anomochaeta]